MLTEFNLLRVTANSEAMAHLREMLEGIEEERHFKKKGGEGKKTRGQRVKD